MRRIFEAKIITEKLLAPFVEQHVNAGWNLVQVVPSGPGKYLVLFEKTVNS
jgi:hypothetical protein